MDFSVSDFWGRIRILDFLGLNPFLGLRVESEPENPKNLKSKPESKLENPKNLKSKPNPKPRLFFGFETLTQEKAQIVLSKTYLNYDDFKAIRPILGISILPF